MLPNNEFFRYSLGNYFIWTTFYALSNGEIEISEECSQKIKQTDFGGQFSRKSTFEPTLLGLAHDFVRNQILFPA